MTRHARSPFRSLVGARQGAPGPRRRGMAILLVLIALGAGTTLASALLSGRASAPALGANAVNAAASDWNARSACNIALAVLQTSTAPSALPTAGTIFTGLSVNGGSVNAYVTDLSGDPPAASSTDLLVTTVATRNGVKSVSQRLVAYRPSLNVADAIEPEMNEFALFANSSLQIEDAASVMPWKLSPSATTARPVKIGLGFTSRSNMTIGTAARLVSTALYPTAGASVSFQADITGRFCGGQILPIAPRALPQAPPASVTSAPVVATSDLTFTGAGQSTALPPGKRRSVTATGGAVVTLGTGDYSFYDLMAQSQGVIRIAGQARVLIEDDLRIEARSAIDFADATSSVVFYVGDEFRVDDSVVGFPQTVALDPGRSAASVTAYQSPARVRIISLTPSAGGNSGRNYTISTSSLLAASIHAPNQSVDISSSSVYGRITGDSIRIRPYARVFYDPALDRGMGFTSRTGPLYQSDGTPLNMLVPTLAAFNAALGGQDMPSWVQNQMISLGVIITTLPGVVVGAPTARNGQRASGIEWPTAAFAMETPGGAVQINTGLIAKPKNVTPGDATVANAAQPVSTVVN